MSISAWFIWKRIRPRPWLVWCRLESNLFLPSVQRMPQQVTDHSRAKKASSILCCTRELLWAKGGNPCPLEAPAGYREYFVRRDIMRHWIKLPREAVQSPSLEVFWTPLEKDWSNMIQMLCWPCLEQEGEIQTLNMVKYSLLQPKNLQCWEKQTKNIVGFELNKHPTRTVGFIILLQFYRLFHLS